MPIHQLTLFEDTARYAPAPRRAARRTSLQAAQAKALREALAPYVDFPRLKNLAASGSDVRQALRAAPPTEVQQLLDVLAALLALPEECYQIKSPADAAALLMLEMSHLDQEQLRTLLLDTKNRVKAIHTVYQGSVDAALIRVSEVFKAAIRQNAPAIILAHNHPSGAPDPSPEDILVTRQIIEAGELLDIQVVDHLVIGQGRWVSLRERGLAFSSP